MARPSNTEARRAQISRALIKVMAKRGYEGASIAGIAKAARLTPGLVHYHFESKQDILLAALRGLTAQHEAILESRLEAATDPLAQVEAFIDVHLGLGADADPEALACWILLSGEALREPKVRAGGIGQRLIDCDAADAAASAIIALVQGYFVLAATARRLIPKGSAAPSARHLAQALLRPARSLAAARTGS